MNQVFTSAYALPLRAAPEEYINRPLVGSISSLANAIGVAEKDPSFEHAFDVCDFARSAFSAYLVESALNGGAKFRGQIVKLMEGAQRVLEGALALERKGGGNKAPYLEEYVLHNSNRLRVVEVLHKEGREAAENHLVCA